MIFPEHVPFLGCLLDGGPRETHCQQGHQTPGEVWASARSQESDENARFWGATNPQVL